ncbi:MAG: M67 family metallopeptidase [Candidatus Omnitrophica bacterium]|nr:M67 family metallopeptidase [Candidatus Omnitrophota bacterium]
MRNAKLVIPRTRYDEIIAHCRSRYPKEACGILAGSREQGAGSEGTLVQVYSMRNVEDSPIGYSMDPKEQLLIEKQMRMSGQRMIGIFHSHTATDAYPSPVDVRLSISPDISYVLVSLKHLDEPVIKSYRIDGARVTEEPVEIG